VAGPGGSKVVLNHHPEVGPADRQGLFVEISDSNFRTDARIKDL
jgi:hypothetical protein